MPLKLSQANGNVFENELNKFLKIFEPYLEKYFKDKIKSLGDYPPLIRQFWRDLFDFTLQGKRLRAFLVYLGYINVSNTPGVNLAGALHTPGVSKVGLRRLLPICLAFEVIHSFLLIHDDIIDKSGKRRGKLTIHKRYEKLADEHYGVSQAIIIGDIACFEAIKLVNSSDFASEIKMLCLDKLVDVILETAYGEALDVENALFKKRAKVSVSDIWRVTDLKTARYSFVGPLVIGAMLARADEKQIQTLTKFGLLVGKVFQLQDDILGIFGNEKRIGKSTLSDLREGKNSLLIFKTLELANIRQKQNFLKLWGKKNANLPDLQKVKKIIMYTGAFDWCQEEKLTLINLAQSQIKIITPDSKLRAIYRQLSDFVVNRES